MGAAGAMGAGRRMAVAPRLGGSHEDTHGAHRADDDVQSDGAGGRASAAGAAGRLVFGAVLGGLLVAGGGVCAANAESLDVAREGWRLAEAGAGSVTVDSLVGGMLAGAVAGAAVDIVLYPIDTVKTRLQTSGTIGISVSDWKQLYSGLTGGLVGHVPSSALFFAVYETTRVLYLEPKLGIGSGSSQLLASALGNIAASTIRVPTEVVKTRMQSGAESSLGDTVSNILERDGIPGLFRGYPAFLLRDLPFDAIEFVAYEQLKIAYASMAGLSVGALGGAQTALIGAIAGGITGALTTPLDTVRARQMNEAGEGEKGYGNIQSAFSRIVEEGGWQGLFAGVKARVLWLSLGGTVFFTSLEAAKDVFLK